MSLKIRAGSLGSKPHPRMKWFSYLNSLALFAILSKSFASNSLDQQQAQVCALSEMVQ